MKEQRSQEILTRGHQISAAISSVRIAKNVILFFGREVPIEITLSPSLIPSTST